MKSGEEEQDSTCVPLECGPLEDCSDALGIDLEFTEEQLVVTCDAGNLDFGQTFTVDVEVALSPGEHSMTATVSTTSTDLIEGNNSANVSGTVARSTLGPASSRLMNSVPPAKELAWREI